MRVINHSLGFLTVLVLIVFSMVNVHAAQVPTPGSLEKMVEQAKKEGKVTVYGSYSYDEAKVIQSAFNKRYPFIKFEHVSMGASDVVTRVMMESKAGTAGADVALTGAPTFLSVVKEGYLRQVDWASLGVQSSAIDTSWGVTCATVTYVLARNTKLVTAANAPKNWQDLLDPKWKGAVGIWVNPIPFSDLVPAMGEAQVMEYLKKLMQNEPMVIREGAEIPSRIVAGEVSVGVVIDETLRRVVDKGGPIDWVWPDPIPVVRYDAAVPTLARNPNAAALFAVWLASPEGSATYEKATGRGSIFIPGSPIAQKTKGKKYSFWPTEQSAGRAAAVKRFAPIITPY